MSRRQPSEGPKPLAGGGREGGVVAVRIVEYSDYL